jgi:hypothetical protein
VTYLMCDWSTKPDPCGQVKVRPGMFLDRLNDVFVSKSELSAPYRQVSLSYAGKDDVIDWNALAGEHHTWVSNGRPGGLAGFVTAAVSVGAAIDSPVGRAAAAMMAVRPVRMPAQPPDAVWAALRKQVEGAPTNPIDIVIAFGCGWRRDTSGGTNLGWFGRWSGALSEFITEVRRSIESARHLLSTVVPDLEINRDDVIELSPIMALGLLGACDCDHHLLGCKGRCGRQCCFADHDLAEWEPSPTVGLRTFIDQAVRGEAKAGLRGGAFAESMLYRSLEAEGRVLVRKVEVVRCPACRTDFEGLVCPAPECGRYADDATPRRARSNWLIIPEVTGGSYSEVKRLVCGNPTCARLYPRRREPECPSCGWVAESGVTPRSISVWTRLARRSTMAGDHDV